MHTMTMTKTSIAQAVMELRRWQKNHTKRIAKLYAQLCVHRLLFQTENRIREYPWLFFSGWKMLFSYREIKMVHRISLQICKLPHFFPSLWQYLWFNFLSELVFCCSNTQELFLSFFLSFFIIPRSMDVFSRCFFHSSFIYFVNLRFLRRTVNACCIYELVCFSI